MRKRAFRAAAVTASLLLMVAVPAHASPVQIGEVTQVVSGSQPNGGQNASVELRHLSNVDRATAGTSTTATTSGDISTSGNSSSSGITTTAQDPGAVVQTEVTEDIGVEECECGDFKVPVAGFPIWPFIPLAGLVFLPGIFTGDKSTPKAGEDANSPPITVCTDCNQVPEPASLLLFGSGIAALGARLRRRTQIKDQAATTSGS
ncbi:MAG: PEP-CTERM sorting domain-containing protein [Acidobacteria bacterium]|nr:PEP-CTERM sorting domain-containing protein [Acidobacteriota bacterium]